MLKMEVLELQREEERLQKQMEKEKLKKEIEEHRLRVRKFKCKNQSDSKLTAMKSRATEVRSKVQTEREDIDISDLRLGNKLKKAVQRELRSLGLNKYYESDGLLVSASSDDNSYSDDMLRSEKSGRHSNEKKNSGINAKSSDRVKDPQRWPHAHLQFEYVNKHLKLEDLDFKTFVAGEFEIIALNDFSKVKKSGRLALLRKIVYYSNTYEFNGLKSFYAAWLREIELDKRTWSDDRKIMKPF